MVEESDLLEQLKVCINYSSGSGLLITGADICTSFSDYQGLLLAGSWRTLPGFYRPCTAHAEDAPNSRHRAR